MPEREPHDDEPDKARGAVIPVAGGAEGAGTPGATTAGTTGAGTASGTSAGHAAVGKAGAGAAGTAGNATAGTTGAGTAGGTTAGHAALGKAGSAAVGKAGTGAAGTAGNATAGTTGAATAGTAGTTSPAGTAGGPLPGGTAGRSGPSISTKAALITAGAVVTAITAAVVAFLLLRPDPPRQTASEQLPGSPPNAAAPAEGAESPTGWTGEYEVTSYQKIRDTFGGCDYREINPVSLSVSGATITILGMTGTMTGDTFTASDSRSVMDYVVDGSFTRTGNVSTLNMTYTYSYTDPINAGNACVYRYTATRRG